MKVKSSHVSTPVSSYASVEEACKYQFIGINGLPREDEIEKSRGTALLQSSAMTIQYLDKNELLVLQSVLQHGSTYGIWVTPKRWNPTDHSHARMNIDLRKRVADFLQKYINCYSDIVVSKPSAFTTSNNATGYCFLDRILDEAVLTLTRYLLLLRIGPSAFGRKGANGSLDPSNIRMLAYDVLPRILSLAISKSLATITPERVDCHQDYQDALPPYLPSLNPEDLKGLSHSVKSVALNELNRMIFLSEQGFWNEAPFIIRPATVTRVSGPTLGHAEERKKSPHLPLPDDYISEMGKRSLWLIHDLAPNLLSIVTWIRQVWIETESRELTPKQSEQSRRKSIHNYLKTYAWTDSQGRIFHDPPFALQLSRAGKKRENPINLEFYEAGTIPITDSRSESSLSPPMPLTWPPTGFGQITALLNHVQLAHLFIVALSTGARKSETLDLSRSCVHYARDGMPLANGLTFKLVKHNAGELRDWVLPDLAVEALEQQVRLVTEVESIGPQKPGSNLANTGCVEEQHTHMWAQLSGASKSNPKAQLLGLNHALTKYAQAIGMSTAPGNQSLRHHRFRKTIARLAALAMTQAPKVMMDVFGHKSIEQTLYYILTDKDLAAEIEQVSRELTVMRATEVIEKIIAAENAALTEIPLAGYGGPAALMVQRSINVQKERLHAVGADWGADSAHELADILTLHGKSWSLVRRGIICTKYPGTEAGPCNKSRGKPEPSHCQSHCAYRLEEAFLRDDVDNSIRDALAAYNKARESGDELLEALWAGQVRANIGRFEDLRRKWENDASVHFLLHNGIRINNDHQY